MKLLKKTVALLLVCLSAAFAGCAYFENVTSESTLGNISVGNRRTRSHPLTKAFSIYQLTILKSFTL
ncbi:MAG: hypothetical protein J6D11_08650 [Clostridia bacterium]|nr:hypothetical protein [Clostridia bacterium]